MQPCIFPYDAYGYLRTRALSLYEQYLIKYGEPEPDKVLIPPAPERAEMHQVDMKEF